MLLYKTAFLLIKERKTRAGWSLKGHLLVLYDRGVPTVAVSLKHQRLEASVQTGVRAGVEGREQQGCLTETTTLGARKSSAEGAEHFMDPGAGGG